MENNNENQDTTDTTNTNNSWRYNRSRSRSNESVENVNTNSNANATSGTTSSSYISSLFSSPNLTSFSRRTSNSSTYSSNSHNRRDSNQNHNQNHLVNNDENIHDSLDSDSDDSSEREMFDYNRERYEMEEEVLQDLNNFDLSGGGGGNEIEFEEEERHVSQSILSLSPNPLNNERGEQQLLSKSSNISNSSSSYPDTGTGSGAGRADQSSLRRKRSLSVGSDILIGVGNLTNLTDRLRSFVRTGSTSLSTSDAKSDQQTLSSSQIQDKLRPKVITPDRDIENPTDREREVRGEDTTSGKSVIHYTSEESFNEFGKSVDGIELTSQQNYKNEHGNSPKQSKIDYTPDGKSDVNNIAFIRADFSNGTPGSRQQINPSEKQITDDYHHSFDETSQNDFFNFNNKNIIKERKGMDFQFREFKLDGNRVYSVDKDFRLKDLYQYIFNHAIKTLNTSPPQKSFSDSSGGYDQNISEDNREEIHSPVHKDIQVNPLTPSRENNPSTDGGVLKSKTRKVSPGTATNNHEMRLKSQINDHVRFNVPKEDNSTPQVSKLSRRHSMPSNTSMKDISKFYQEEAFKNVNSNDMPPSHLSRTKYDVPRTNHQVNYKKGYSNNQINSNSVNLKAAPLQPQDLRKLTNPIPTQLNEPAITVRRHVILLNFDGYTPNKNMRAIVLFDRVLLYVPQGTDTLLYQFESRLNQVLEEYISETDVNSSYGEKSEYYTADTPNKNSAKNKNLSSAGERPFELVAVESVLSTVCYFTDMEIEKNKARWEKLSKKVLSQKGSTSSLAQDQLRYLKTIVNTEGARVRNIRRAVESLLDDDEDLEAMCLTAVRKPMGDFKTESELMEILLESYYQDIISDANTLEILGNEIENTEELVLLRLDTARNRLLTVTTVFTFFNFFVACSTYIAGLFGMNLDNGLYPTKSNTTKYFNQVCWISGIGVIAFTIIIMWRLRASGILTI